MKFTSPTANLLLVLALWDGQVSANPKHGEMVIARAVNCKVVTGVLAVVKALGAPATSFCSSYLNIAPTSTVKTTTTPTTAKTITAAPVVVTVTAANCPAPQAPRIKRGGKHVPPGLNLYAENEISSACACLSLKPKATTTITNTAATVVVQTTITPTSTACVRDCTPVGQPCIFEDPGRCCSQTCACISGVCNCFQL